MSALVIYESMYGNTHLVADAIAEGLRDFMATDVLAVGDAMPSLLASAELVVVGGPTHVHGLSRTNTRKAAIDAAGDELDLDPDAEGVGLRDWFETLDTVDVLAAAFDTRLDGPSVFTGRASKGIARRLVHHGMHLVTPPESFLVTKDTHLEHGEAERARAWGRSVAQALRLSHPAH